MKIALVHDHLAQDGGAERVLIALKEMFPEAPIFTLLIDRNNTNAFFRDKEIKTSFLQKIPLGVKRYQWWLALMPLATESHNLEDYDLIISSASSFSKGVITKPGSLHICYCHTPTRFLWTDTYSYVEGLKVNPLVKMILPFTLRKLRQWDKLASDRVDFFVANSKTVQSRIKKYYNRESEIIYPPVDVSSFYISSRPKKYYLAGGRLVPYKKIDLAVKAFSRLGIPLKIFGVGPEMKYLKNLAKSNIKFLGKVSDEQKKSLYANCLAYLNPQEEDFGITAVEAMAAGRPVIAYKSGGATETIIEGQTGEFFEEQWWEELADKVIRFNSQKYDPYFIRSQAEKFSVDNFKNKVNSLLSKMTENYENRD
ncbi:MAG: glycosyltransferase [Candidatus Buchananbacteria bacterium]|nr:glycosyltransferase [Candidatus Buchananbacteria bacterium]